MSFPPRLGDPRLDVTIPSAEQGKTPGKEPSPVAISEQYRQQDDLDTAADKTEFSQDITSLQELGLVAWGTLSVTDGQLDEDMRLEGISYAGTSGTNLVFKLDTPRSERYGVSPSLEDTVALIYPTARDPEGFELEAYDIPGAAALDLSAGTHVVTVLISGSE